MVAEQERATAADAGGDADSAKGKLSLRPAGRLELGKTVDGGSVRQSFSHGRSKVVQVEVVKKRVVGAPGPTPGAATPAPGQPPARGAAPRQLTNEERTARMRAVQEAQKEQAKRDAERREQEQNIAILSAAEAARRAAEEEARRAIEAEAALRAEIEAKVRAAEDARREAEAAEAAKRAAEAEDAAPAPAPVRAPQPARAPAPAATPEGTLRLKKGAAREEDDDTPRNARRPGGVAGLKKPAAAPAKKALSDPRRQGRIDVDAALAGEDEKTRSLASVRRQRERERRQAELEALRNDQVKVVREVVLPEAITVQELANRMAARGGDVIKALMKLGVMATITQSIEADTAQLVVEEFGHRVKRVSESDVEEGLDGEVDAEIDLDPRPPVVTVMGHVDHGKTSLLDALRSTDVAAHEAGGITQHIGAYQVTLAEKNELGEDKRITFIDTPGHEAFTAMRARGASVTDIVVLVVAADDGVMPQTIEAIRHAKAANAPIIVAINKIDREGANPERVRTELLSHEIVVESMGGDTQDVEVSALKRIGLDKLQEAILLQAEVLDLKANPARAAEGAVIESKLDRGRGPVATVLVQRGTLEQGDIVVAGSEWGRVRAMLDDKGKQLKTAGPAMPVEILGLAGVPGAGEPFVAVEDEARAREISEFRQRKAREKNAGNLAARGTIEEMMSRIAAGAQKEVAVVVKADVQGTAEAISVTLAKVSREEVRVRVLLSGVGQITESDIQLARASNAIVVAFNVRATAQARELAARDGVDIRYYSIIYQVADDIEAMVVGKLAPIQRETFLGYASILEVFDITRIGKVAGCRVTEGVVRRGAGVRLLRDGTVIHQGELSTLRRFKDDVREVTNGYECGMSFANYSDIRVGDQIECYETESVAAT
jgi:translation initiation factor IF-2